MAVLFPEIQHEILSVQTRAHDSYDHVTVCSEEGLAPGELWSPRGVAIDTATNHIYVAEGDGTCVARVSIFSENGCHLSSHTHELMKSLWGIAVHGNHVYVTDDRVHAVFRFKIENGFSLVAKLGDRGTKIGQFQYPCQLSVSPNGEVYVADSYNHRIQILDSSLHPMREVTHPSLSYPRDVQLTKEEIYVLSYGEATCIHVFSYAGVKIRSLITRGEGMQVVRPYFFRIGANSSILISDFHGNLIKVFSSNGVLLHTIGEQGQQVGMFISPNGLALTPNLKLATVSWNPNYRLQIFYSSITERPC